MLGRRQEWQAIAATAKPDTASDTANGSSEGTDGSVLMVCSGLYRKRTPLQEKKKKKKVAAIEESTQRPSCPQHE